MNPTPSNQKFNKEYPSSGSFDFNAPQMGYPYPYPYFPQGQERFFDYLGRRPSFSNQQMTQGGDPQGSWGQFDPGTNGQFMENQPQPSNQTPSSQRDSPMMNGVKEEFDQATTKPGTDFIQYDQPATAKSDDDIIFSNDQTSSYDDELSQSLDKDFLEINNNVKTKDKKQLFTQISSYYEYDWKDIARRLFDLASDRLGFQNAHKILINPKDREAEEEFTKNKRFSDQEDRKIVSLVGKVGLNWKKLSRELPGRKPLVIKNRYYYLKKKGQIDENGSEVDELKGQSSAESTQPDSEQKEGRVDSVVRVHGRIQKDGIRKNKDFKKI